MFARTRERMTIVLGNLFAGNDAKVKGSGESRWGRNIVINTINLCIINGLQPMALHQTDNSFDDFH